jgi:hypothetical protein
LAPQRIGTHPDTISFRSLVKDCATESQLVASFNLAYGMQLQAPIAALLEDRWPHQLSEGEELQIGCFILFVHENIWQRFQRAQLSMEKTRTTR